MLLINNSTLILLSILSCLFTAICILSFTKIAHNIGLIDRKNDRKLHQGEIPLIGGISIFLGFTLAILVSPIGLGEFRALFAASILIVIVGFLDDMHELSSKTKIVLEIFLIFICIFWGGIRLFSLGDLLFFGNIHLGSFTVFFTTFAMLGIINAINMLDGSDGVAGVSAVLQLIFLSYISYQSHLFNSFYLIVLLISALCGFLIFNLPKSNSKQNSYLVFLGDSGSLFLGLFIVWFTISLSQYPQTTASPIVMLWIMALPIYDTISVIIHRILTKHSPFEARRDHFHHSFGKNSPLKIVAYIFLLNLIFGSTGIILNEMQIHEGFSFVLFFITALFFLAWKLKKHYF
jgi:UDP-GlcNAc:undecaprenyl-phosphate GlcNAc-1-phosphate transferase